MKINKKILIPFFAAILLVAFLGRSTLYKGFLKINNFVEIPKLQYGTPTVPEKIPDQNKKQLLLRLLPPDGNQPCQLQQWFDALPLAITAVGSDIRIESIGYKPRSLFDRDASIPITISLTWLVDKVSLFANGQEIKPPQPLGTPFAQTTDVYFGSIHRTIPSGKTEIWRMKAYLNPRLPWYMPHDIYFNITQDMPLVHPEYFVAFDDEGNKILPTSADYGEYPGDEAMNDGLLNLYENGLRSTPPENRRDMEVQCHIPFANN
ncbi:MAG: hypothetical protein AAB588_00045 [Patescibacteria group bacterium]